MAAKALSKNWTVSLVHVECPKTGLRKKKKSNKIRSLTVSERDG